MSIKVNGRFLNWINPRCMLIIKLIHVKCVDNVSTLPMIKSRFKVELWFKSELNQPQKIPKNNKSVEEGAALCFIPLKKKSLDCMFTSKLYKLGFVLFSWFVSSKKICVIWTLVKYCYLIIRLFICFQPSSQICVV